MQERLIEASGLAKEKGMEGFHPGLKVDNERMIVIPDKPYVHDETFPEGQLMAHSAHWEGVMSPLVIAGQRNGGANYGSSVLLTPVVKVLNT